MEDLNAWLSSMVPALPHPTLLGRDHIWRMIAALVLSYLPPSLSASGL